jgi:hypothetical protein
MGRGHGGRGRAPGARIRSCESRRGGDGSGGSQEDGGESWGAGLHVATARCRLVAVSVVAVCMWLPVSCGSRGPRRFTRRCLIVEALAASEW